jgi:hypothetical protein
MYILQLFAVKMPNAAFFTEYSLNKYIETIRIKKKLGYPKPIK